MEAVGTGAGSGVAGNGEQRATTSAGSQLDVSDSLISYKQIGRNGAPEWGGPTVILGVKETGATVAFQNQTFKVARY